MKVRFSLLIFLVSLSFSIFAQQQSWNELSTSDLERLQVKNQLITPVDYKVFATDFQELTNYLNRQDAGSFELEIPFPDGTVQLFECSNAALIPDVLQEKYPSIRSFDGRGKTVRGSKVKFGISPKGFHAMVLIPGSSPVFVDVLSQGMTSYYMSYYKENYEPIESFSCEFEGESLIPESIEIESMAFAGDCQLRSYRLALACSGEYATFHGGTVESTLAEFAVAMARVNGIYEKDLGITMVFVENTDEVIFLNGATDPYTNNSGGAMLGENQQTLDDIIGSANYDIGHVFSTGGGGIAALQSPCNNNRKAQGVTGLGSPVNDPFYVDYVCHEIGHQFGANHTQNNSCQRNGNTAMEVGSANTIMGYAGICNPNSKNNSDDHFHAVSILEISNYIVNGNGNSCDELVAIENVPPVVTIAGTVYSIPADTPFMLSAEGSDDDGDVLTYCWEQMDNEIANMPPELLNTGGPAFISNSPLLSETRVFPNMDAVVNNLTPTWEVLPSVTRQMNFRCTVRDNHNMFGCTDEVDVELNVDGNTGPFLVQYPNTQVSWQAAMEEIVEWDVANTDGGTVNCMLVDILLSIDGGFTYPITLAEQVPNDGSQAIVVPAEFTSTARVMVKCATNVFFDISNTNFSIETPFSVDLDQEEIIACQGDQAVIEVSTMGFDGFADAIEFSLENVPAGVDYSFSVNPVNTPESTTLSFSSIAPEAGEYTVTLVGTAPGVTINKTIELTVESNEVSDFVLLLPEDGQTAIGQSTDVSWDAIPGVNDYLLVVSTSPSFSNPITINVSNATSASLTGLEVNTVYYWKVEVNSLCSGESNSETFAFQTQKEAICQVQSSANLPLEIPANAVGDFAAGLNVEGVSSFDFIKCYINLEHSYLGDITYRLTSPSGTELVLMDQIGVPASQFGCSENDLEVTFSDFADFSAELLEEACGEYETEYQPVNALSALNGEDPNGEWILTVSDVFDQDGGQVVDWSLEFCSNVGNDDPTLVNETLFVNTSGQGIVASDLLNIEQLNPGASEFTLLSLPQHGELQAFSEIAMDFETLSLGDVFTQEAIDAGEVVYKHNGDDSMLDEFQFDAIDATNNWIHNETFNIIIIEDGNFLVIPSVASPVLCNGDENASILIDVVGDELAFQYSIDGGENFTETSLFENLGAGDYNIVVLDPNGIEIYNQLFTIEDVEVLQANAMSAFYDITVETTGGTAPYMYSLNGVDFSIDSKILDVAQGDYVVTVVDANGCITTADVMHTYETLELGTMVVDVLCFGSSSGQVTVSGLGGFQPYSYSIDGENYDENGTFINLSAGLYTFYIQDAGGATSTQEVQVTENDMISFSLNANSSGFSVQDVTGGSGAYEYSLDDIIYTEIPVFEPMPLGDFTIYVRDENGCVESLDFIEISSSINAVAVSCNGDENGILVAGGTGGFPPFTYSINGVDFQESPTFEDLAAGPYVLSVVDSYGFQSAINFEIDTPDPLTATTDYTGGDLIITASGGSSPYFYSIDGGVTFQAFNTFSITMDGDYEVVVTDSKGCIDESMLTVTLVDNEEVELLSLIEVYPIPVKNELFIDLDASIASSANLRIYNVVGQEIDYNLTKDGNQFVIDVSSWTAGQYVLVIESDQTVVTKKVLKF